MIAISLDTETTGVDFHHGARPFMVASCSEDGTITCWEWDVDPLTRISTVPAGDITAIQELVDCADTIAMHNGKFDAHALAAIGIELPLHKVRDTFFAGHLLATNRRHNLTDMCMEYLGLDIEPLEKKVEGATKDARTVVKGYFPEWRIAREDDPSMPSVSGSSKRDEDKPWKNDMWLCKAALSHWDAPPDWLHVCRDYCCGDAESTLLLWKFCEGEIERRGLSKIYAERMKLLRPYYEMERLGTTMIVAATEQKAEEYGKYVDDADAELVGIAAEFGHELELAEGASINDNMRDFFYGATAQVCQTCSYRKRVKHWNGEVIEDNSAVCPKCASRRKHPQRVILHTFSRENLGLPVIFGKKSGNASLDKDAMEQYRTTLDDGLALDFIEHLIDKRARDTALQFLRSYQRFWVPHGDGGFRRLHPNLNPCGTDHLRAASFNPNGQNISKRESECQECDGGGLDGACRACHGTGKTMSSLRHCFGPATGRVWYSMDLQSIERRIPPYECRNMYGEGDEAMLSVFETPDEPPYWGSLYLLTASVLYPEEYWPLSEKKGEFRKKYPRLYKQSKFFDLAKQYGCGRKKGDLLSRVRGSFDLVDQNFPMLARLQKHYLDFASRYGYVETIPDRKVDPERGYPILASRTDDGRVLSTTPFNYHVSGTACQDKNAALVECQDQVDLWGAESAGQWDGLICLEIHDEILFDFPIDGTEDERAVVMKGIMESCGDRIGIPTPVTAERHDTTWADGVALPEDAVCQVH